MHILFLLADGTATGSVQCLNIWKTTLSLLDVRAYACCEHIGDAFSMVDTGIILHGNATMAMEPMPL